MKKRKTILAAGAVLIFAFAGTGIYFTRSRTITEISEYGNWDKDIDSTLKIFPEKIADQEKTNYYYKKSNGFLEDTYEICLECTYEKKAFQKEVERISKIEDNYQKEIHKVKYDNKNFKYPAYIAMYDFDSSYEYALVNEKEEKIHYIYLQKADKNKIFWNKELLPKQNSDQKESELRYNIYAYALESKDGWYINK